MRPALHVYTFMAYCSFSTLQGIITVVKIYIHFKKQLLFTKYPVWVTNNKKMWISLLWINIKTQQCSCKYCSNYSNRVIWTNNCMWTSIGDLLACKFPACITAWGDVKRLSFYFVSWLWETFGHNIIFIQKISLFLFFFFTVKVLVSDGIRHVVFLYMTTWHFIC